MKIQDIRLSMQRPKNPLEEIFTPRPSSLYRIAANTAFMATGGFFFGIGRAIHRDKSKLKFSMIFCLAGLIPGLFHQTLNEVFTGQLMRRFQQDQYWISNTAAGIITTLTLMVALSRGGPRRIVSAQQIGGSIMVISIILDLWSLAFRRKILFEENFVAEKKIQQ